MDVKMIDMNVITPIKSAGCKFRKITSPMFIISGQPDTVVNMGFNSIQEAKSKLENKCVVVYTAQKIKVENSSEEGVWIRGKIVSEDLFDDVQSWDSYIREEGILAADIDDTTGVPQ